MATLTAMNPNSTLTSSVSTNHLRQTLQALPHLPEDDDKNPPRGRVEHFVPAIWIPDGKTDACMRCGRPFGWRRRRHHCRLCGRCVCGSCSGKVQSAYLDVVNSLNLLVSWLDVLYRRKYEGRRPSQGGTGVWTVLRNRVSCHGRHSLDPRFVNQDGRWYDELSFRLPRVAVGTGFEWRGRWACLLGLLRSLSCRPRTSTRIFIRGQRITSGRSGPRSQPPTPCTDQTSFPPQELPADPGKVQRRQSV
jgi:hypothetical protein